MTDEEIIRIYETGVEATPCAPRCGPDIPGYHSAACHEAREAAGRRAVYMAARADVRGLMAHVEELRDVIDRHTVPAWVYDEAGKLIDENKRLLAALEEARDQRGRLR